MPSDDELLARSEDLDRKAGRITLIPEQRVRERRVMLGLLVVTMLANAVGIWSTRQAVTGQVDVLQARNAELESTVAAQEIVIAQAAAGFSTWCDLIEDLDGECPRIELNPALGMPTTTTTTPGD
jgi:hypothetical protein